MDLTASTFGTPPEMAVAVVECYPKYNATLGVFDYPCGLVLGRENLMNLIPQYYKSLQAVHQHHHAEKHLIGQWQFTETVVKQNWNSHLISFLCDCSERG